MRLPIPRLRAGSIPHEDGRALIRYIQYWRPLEVTTDDVRGYRHPWQVAMRWDGETRQWQAQFHRSSYVAGPAAREVEGPALRWAALPRATRARLGEDPGRAVSPWLSEEPWLPCPADRWRRLGIDAEPVLEGSGEVIPQALRDLGATTAGEQIRIDRSEQTFTVSRNGPPVERRRVRLVRAVDIVLHVPRPRVRLAAADDGEIAIELELAAGDAPYVTIQRGRYDPALEVGDTLSQFAAALDDDGIDRTLAARVYLLSRPGAPDGSPVDRTWRPYVDQGLFWNPQHRTNRELNIVEPLRLRFPTGLAGGAGDTLIQNTLADINQRDALASVLVSQASVVGRFFT
jgi:hypothetical protein